MDREKITLTSAQETMLATLYGKALDSRLPNSILRDHEADKVDYPEVLELRELLLPTPAGEYRMIGASVTDDGWLDAVPDDRPTVAVFEGLSMYLRKEDGKRLIQRITGRFPSGQLLFDCYGTLGIRLQKLVPAVRSVDMPGLDKLPASGRVGMWVMAHIPGFRDIGRILRYRF